MEWNRSLLVTTLTGFNGESNGFGLLGFFQQPQPETPLVREELTHIQDP